VRLSGEVIILEVEQIEISKLRENHFNKEIFDDLPSDTYEELKADIWLNGIKTPLEVTDDYLIISGHQRYKIALELGFEILPCIISSYRSEDEMKERLIKDNLLRRQLNPIEKARAGLALEEIEKKRARERQLAGLRQFSTVVANLPQRGEKGKTRDNVAKAIGMSPRQYDKARKVIESGNKGIIEAVKRRELSVHKAYTNIHREERRIQLQEEKEKIIAELEDKELLGEFMLGDCREVLKTIPDQSIDFIFADPPYFLSEGISTIGGLATPVDKGEWDVPIDIDERYKFSYEWLKGARRVLKDSGTISVSGSYHNIHIVGYAMLKLGYLIHNNIIWVKDSPAPSVTKRRLTEASEILIWARKSKESNGYYFDYDLARELNSGKEMTSVWEIGAIRGNENIGYPTQKPEALLERILQIFTLEGHTVLDPFVGSGTTIIVAQRLKRRWIGIDKSEEALTIARSRLVEEMKGESNNRSLFESEMVSI